MEIIYSTPLKRLLTIWHEAVKLNIPNAQFKLGLLYSNQKTELTSLKAVSWYRKASKQGHLEAQFMLGKCYESGTGVRRSYTHAIRWYKNAYNQVSVNMMDNPELYNDPAGEAISEYLQNNDWSEIDHIINTESENEENAFEIDKYLAEQGDAMAQQRLGHRYYYGQGIEKNRKEAVYWYHQSVEQDCEAAMGRLAEYYEKEKNYNESAKWYRKYADERIIWHNERLG